MKKLALMCIGVLVTMSAISTSAMAGEAVVKRVPAGAVAFHFVLDLTVVPGPPELVGYMGFIEGIDVPLFNGTPSKDTAYFTLRLTKGAPPSFDLPIELDDEFNVSIIPPGAQFTVYFNANPTGRDWSDPGTFAQGVPIAVFEESALLNGALNWFSSSLVDSTPIYFNSQRIDFKKLVPDGVTIINFGSGFRFRPYNGSIGSSIAATALAIGGNLRDE